MTTAVEINVSDGGSTDKVISKAIQLRDLLTQSKKTAGEIGSSTAGGSAAKKSLDALGASASSGAASFQKATGALQNFAAASGNPLISKGTSMLNGLAQGLGKVQTGALAAAGGTGVLAGALTTLAAHPVIAAATALTAALAAALSIMKLFNSVTLEASNYGSLLAGSIDDMTSSTEKLNKASLEYQALKTPETLVALGQAMVDSENKLKILTLAQEEANSKTITWADTWDYLAKKVKGALAEVKSFFGFSSDKIAIQIEEQKKVQANQQKLFSGTGAQAIAAGNAAIDARKAPTATKAGKTAAEVQADALKDAYDAALKLNSAKAAANSLDIQQSRIFDQTLEAKERDLAIERASLEYAKALSEIKGGNNAAQEAALITKNTAEKAAQAAYDARSAESAKETSRITAEENTRNLAATNEIRQLEMDLSQVRLNSLAAIGVLENTSIINQQASLDLARQELLYADGKTQAMINYNAAVSQGMSVELATAEYQRQTEVLNTRNSAITQGIELTKNANLELERQRSLFEDINSLVDSMSTAFGSVGAAIGTSVKALVSLTEKNKTYDTKRALLAKDEIKNAKEISKIDARNIQDNIDGVSAVAGATKDMFAEKTAAHKAFAVIEKATAAVSMAIKAQELAATLAALPATIAGGVSKLFQQGGWAGFAGAGAFLALMGSLGFGGSGGSISAPSMQETQGTGAAGRGGSLGDNTKVNTAIVDGLDRLAENNYELLRYSRGKMYEALLAIESNTSAFARAIAQGRLPGQTEGSSSSSGLFGLNKKSKEVTEAGFTIVGNLMGSIERATFDEVVKTTKKSWYGKKKTDTDRNSTALPSDIQGFLSDMFKAAGDTITSTGAYFNGARSLSDYDLKIKVDTKGMTAAEAKDALLAETGRVIGAAMEDLIPGFSAAQEKFQDLGESALDFAVRISSTADNVTLGLESIGKALTLGKGQTLATFSLQLTELMGGIASYNEKTAFFAENFLTEAERLAPVQKNLREELTKLGLSSIDTRDEFKDLVLGLDLSTTKGKEVYSTLMALAPAFAAVYEESEKLVSTEEKLAKLREEELSLKGKITDAYGRESSALKGTIDGLKGTVDSLNNYRSALGLGAYSTLTPAEKYSAARTALQDTAAAAKAGDKTALSKLTSTADTFLSTSRTLNASSANYAADFRMVQDIVNVATQGVQNQISDAEAQLNVLNDSYSALGLVQENTFNMAELMKQLVAVQQQEVALQPVVTAVDNNSAKSLEEMRTLNNHLANLRKEQEAQSNTLAKSIFGVFTKTTVDTIPTVAAKKEVPYTENPNYYTWEPTGGA